MYFMCICKNIYKERENTCIGWNKWPDTSVQNPSHTYYVEDKEVLLQAYSFWSLNCSYKM